MLDITPARWICWFRVNLVGIRKNFTTRCNSGQGKWDQIGTSFLAAKGHVTWPNCWMFLENIFCEDISRQFVWPTKTSRWRRTRYLLTVPWIPVIHFFGLNDTGALFAIEWWMSFPEEGAGGAEGREHGKDWCLVSTSTGGKCKTPSCHHRFFCRSWTKSGTWARLINFDHLWY